MIDAMCPTEYIAATILAMTDTKLAIILRKAEPIPSRPTEYFMACIFVLEDCIPAAKKYTVINITINDPFKKNILLISNPIVDISAIHNDMKIILLFFCVFAVLPDIHLPIQLPQVGKNIISANIVGL